VLDKRRERRAFVGGTALRLGEKGVIDIQGGSHA
jgi:hypothetical protein